MTFLFDPDTHIYTLDGRVLPSITGILQSEGFINNAFYTEEGRQRGKMAHLAIHYHDTDELDEDFLDPILRPYLEGWKKFKKDTGCRVIESEISYYHPDYLYAGTPDKKVIFRDQLGTLEIKTGHMEPWTAIQTAAQSLLNNTVKRYGVEIDNEGKYRLQEFKDRKDREIWFSVLACHNWKKNNLRR